MDDERKNQWIHLSRVGEKLKGPTERPSSAGENISLIIHQLIPTKFL